VESAGEDGDGELSSPMPDLALKRRTSNDAATLSNLCVSPPMGGEWVGWPAGPLGSTQHSRRGSLAREEEEREGLGKKRGKNGLAGTLQDPHTRSAVRPLLSPFALLLLHPFE
jgi:hypothetical protein